MGRHPLGRLVVDATAMGGLVSRGLASPMNATAPADAGGSSPGAFERVPGAFGDADAMASDAP